MSSKLSLKSSLNRIAGIAQLVERYLAKVQVAGSNPVSRSNLNFFFFFCKKVLYSGFSRINYAEIEHYKFKCIILLTFVDLYNRQLGPEPVVFFSSFYS